MSTGRKKKERISPVHPASRTREWKIRAWDASRRLAGSLSSSRDHRETAAALMQAATEGLGIGCQAVYLDEDGGGLLRLLHGGRIEQGTLPRCVSSGSAFVRHVSSGVSSEPVGSFFETAGELTGSELELRDSFELAGIDSACPMMFGGETIGLYLFAAEECRGGGDIAREAAGVLTSIAASKLACQLVSDDRFASAQNLEKLRRRELRAVMNAVIDKTAADIETSLGVLRSGLWSIDVEHCGEDGGLDVAGGGSVMMGMARDASIRLAAKVRELVAIGRLDASEDEPELEEIEMADVVEDVTRELIAEFEKKGMSVSIEDRAIGRLFHAEPARALYVVRSVVEHVMQSGPRDSAIEIYWAVSDEGPGGEDGMWMVLSVSGSGTPDKGDAIDNILDSIEAEYSGDPGPPADSGLTLSEYIARSSGGALLRGEDGNCISVYFPI